MRCRADQVGGYYRKAGIQKMKIRLAEKQDVGRLMEIFNIAREYQRTHGNPTQWENGYPQKALVLRDIETGVCYVVEEEGWIVATLSLIYGADKTYAVIEQGSWKSDAPYATVHRMASDGTVKGVAAFALEWCGKKERHLRADTHKDNLTMQHILQKEGFKYCGIIHVEDGTERLAYEKY